MSQHIRSADAKVLGLDQMLLERQKLKAAGLKLVFTNGCFDILHTGHADYLAFARRQGDALAVGVNSDASVRCNKGPSRPINAQHDRALLLAAMDAVDYVVVFDETEPATVVERILPDVLVKGEDWAHYVSGREAVEHNGGRMILARMVQGKTAMITGASAGIGAASAVALAERGFRVCLMARRRDRLERLAGLIRALAGREDAAIVFAGDVTKEDDCRGVVDSAMQAWGRLDVLVNNAGAALAGALEDVSLAEARSQFEVNTLGPLAMMQSVGPILRRQGHGRIINISSISGVMALPGLGVYSASKYALEALSDAARREYAPWGVKVILIQPGGIATEIWDAAKADLAARRIRAAQSPFREFYDFQLRQLDDLLHGGTAVKVVCAAIVHAATARRPRPRYCMPRQCRLRKLVAHLPTAIEDWIVRRYVRVTPPRSDSESRAEG